MATDPQWPLQQAIYSALTGDSALMALISGVHDHVDRGSAPPYVVIGDMQVTDASPKSGDQVEVLVTIDTWDDVHRGMKTTQEVMAAVMNVLDRATLSVTGFNAPIARFTFSDVFNDPDGITRHGVQQFRFLICA